MNGLWLVWGAGFVTGGMSAYLCCIVFCRAILKNEGEIVAFLESKKAKALDASALNSFLKGWENHMERKKYGTDL